MKLFVKANIKEGEKSINYLDDALVVFLKICRKWKREEVQTLVEWEQVKHTFKPIGWMIAIKLPITVNVRYINPNTVSEGTGQAQLIFGFRRRIPLGSKTFKNSLFKFWKPV